MKHQIKNSSVFSIILSTFLLACQGKGDVNLNKAKQLVPEVVPGLTTGSGDADVTPHSLFTGAKGEAVPMSKLGTIDPVGTALNNDYDGDGITNDKEPMGSLWVADYPQIEASIATPVVMKIQILKTSSETSEEIVSNISSDDYENNKNQGSENLHRNELNERTTQITDEFAGSETTSGSTFREVEAHADVTIKGIGIGGGGKSAKGESWSKTHAWSKTETKFPDVPFKNNLDSDGWHLKSDSAAALSRNYRITKNQKLQSGFEIKPNAGIVRAALYIKNLSVNMPVKLSNILCTFVLETPRGDFVPMQSFRLRNDDYSLFEVSIYGDSEFGPYVIELPNLNTVEIENALQKGYNPKIFVVDYDMTHVQDSNYRSVLTNYTGNNVKIVEENSKGRTALLKIKGPNLRAMYRIAAFTVDTEPATGCAAPVSAGTATPGISLKKALNRLSCLGVGFEFEDYIVEMDDILPKLAEGKVFVHGIKQVGETDSTMPCQSETKVGNDGNSRTVCRMKKVSEMTETELANSGLWVVFANGTYYSHSEYKKKNDGNKLYYDAEETVPAVKGIESDIWAGDNFDIVYMKLSDIVDTRTQFGVNPLETGETKKVNTAWDKSKSPEQVYDPDFRSVFLGQASPGDQIEMTFNLDSTLLLNPSFGPNKSDLTTKNIYDEFQYNWSYNPKRYELIEAADFEINLGLGGQPGDWTHIITGVKSAAAATSSDFINCGQTLNYLEQKFKVCVQLPASIELVDPESPSVNLYLRPVIRNIYRNVIWPQQANRVSKFSATLKSFDTTALKIRVSAGVGNTNAIAPGVNPLTVLSGGIERNYQIDHITPILDDQNQVEAYDFFLVTGQTLYSGLQIGDRAYVKGNLTESQVTLEYDAGFYNAWNATPHNGFFIGDALLGSTSSQYGFSVSNLAYNWVGYTNKNFDYTDAAKFDTWLSSPLNPLVSTPSVTDGPNTHHIRVLMPDVTEQPPTIQNYTIREDFGGTPLKPYSAVYGNKSLTVWSDSENAFTIKGRFIDHTTQTMGPIFDISSLGTATPTFKFLTYQDAVFVLWYDGTTIRLRRVNLADGTMSSIITIASNPSLYEDSLEFAVDSSSGKMIILYSANSVSADLLMQVMDMGSYALLASPITVDTNTNENQIARHIVASDGKAVLVWTSYNTLSNTRSLKTKVIRNLNNLVPDLDDSLVLDGNVGDTVTNETSGYRAAKYLDKALVCWANSSAPGDPVIKAVFLNLALTGNSALGTIQTPGNGSYVSAVNYTDLGLIVNFSTDTNGFITLESRKFSFAGSGSIDPVQRISTMTDVTLAMIPENVLSFSMAMKSQTAWISWTDLNFAQGMANIALVSKDLVNNLQSDILMVNQVGPINLAPDVDLAVILGEDGSPFISWKLWDIATNVADVIGATVPVQPGGGLLYGLNNFFTAPLMERQYSVTARIK